MDTAGHGRLHGTSLTVHSVPKGRNGQMCFRRTTWDCPFCPGMYTYIYASHCNGGLHGMGGCGLGVLRVPDCGHFGHPKIPCDC